MVSMGEQRSAYVDENNSSSSDEYDYDGYAVKLEKVSDSEDYGAVSRSGRRPKCFSRNAVMARENRLKKKLYLQKLEAQVSALKSEKRKLCSLITNQSSAISELRKEVTYVKSVLANSSDISRLIKNIHQTTGMSVTTSLNADLALLRNDCVSKRGQVPIARKTPHPWEEADYTLPDTKQVETDLANCLTPNSLMSVSPQSCHDDYDSFLFDDNMLGLDDDFLNSVAACNENFSRQVDADSALSEHNYTATPRPMKEEEDDDDDGAGVCLHVSKHRVSLEFCSGCNDSAFEVWKKKE